MDVQDVAIKRTDPLRVAASTARAPGFGHENVGPVIARLLPEVLDALRTAGVRPGVCVAYYDEPDDDGAVVVHAGFEIGDLELVGNERINVIRLAIVEVAALVHRGSMDEIESVYDALVRWIEDSGYRLAGRSRELYHEWHDEDPSKNVTEIQLPVAK